MDKDFGPYELRHRIGNGGMAWVWFGVHKELDLPVAVKILYPQFAEDETFSQRFIAGARSAARLQHANIVRVMFSGRHEAGPFIVMEFIEGANLAQWLTDHPPPPLEISLLMLRDIARGLEAAHAQNIIHRDLKPANAMFARDGAVKLVDFDLSRRLDDAMHLTRTGMALGTVHYMSPEQADALPVGKTSDIFSLGVICYEMLCGVRPFPGNSDSEVRIARQHDPSPMEVVNPLVPARVSAIVRRMLARDPEQRVQSVTEVRRELDAAIHDLGLFDEHVALAEYAAEPERVRNELIQKRLATHLTRAQSAEVRGPEGQAEAMREYACVLHLDSANDQARKALLRLQAYAEARVALEQKRAKESGEARVREEAEARARAEREERLRAEIAAREARALEERERAAAEAREKLAIEARARAEREAKEREAAAARQLREEEDRRRAEEARRAVEGHEAQDPDRTVIYPTPPAPVVPPSSPPVPPRVVPAPADDATPDELEVPVPPTPPGPPRPWNRTVPLLVGAGVTLVAVIAALIFHPWDQRRPEPAPIPVPGPTPLPPDSTPPPSPEPIPPSSRFARLRVETTPAGARATLDREIRRTTPALFDSLSAGPHRVFIRRPGYGDTLREFTLASGTDTVITVALRPLPVEKLVTLSVSATPPDAEVRLDGRAAQAGGATRFTNLRRGDYTLEATRSGYRPARRTVALSGLRDTTVLLALEVLPSPTLRKAKLRVSSNPAGAKLRLDGRVEQTATHSFTDVTEGMHQLTVSKEGYESELRTFGFTARKDSAISVVLRHLSVPPPAPVLPDGYFSISAVPWADVYLDGKLLEGHVTQKTFAARPGSHRLELKHPLFTGTSDNIKIESGVTLPALSPGFETIAGTLIVECPGSVGAEVVVKGIVVGTAPATIMVGPGSYKVTVRMAGRRPLEGDRQVRIRTGETHREVFTLVAN